VKTGVKLGGFALILVVVFTVAYIAGTYVPPQW
jgi:hypothetical protein